MAKMKIKTYEIVTDNGEYTHTLTATTVFAPKQDGSNSVRIGSTILYFEDGDRIRRITALKQAKKK